MSSLYKNSQRLKNYFLGRTVVVKSNGNKLKVKTVDPSVRTLNNIWNITGGGGQSNNSIGYNNYYGQRTMNRMFLMYEYDLMERDPIISRALTILSQETCLPDDMGEIVHIQTDFEDVRLNLEALFNDVLKVESLLQLWVRHMIKYGDAYLYLNLQDGIGVTDVINIGNADVERIENIETGETKFKISALGSDEIGEEKIIHFRHTLSMEYLPYGASILESVRKYWKMMTLLEDFMMVYYLLRSVNQRVFRVDVGMLAPNKIPAFIEGIRQMYKKKPLVNKETGEYDMYYDPITILDDIILPVREGYENTTFDEISASPETDIEKGITLLRLKILSGLGVPNFLLNYEEQINSKSTASGEDIRFAKSCESLQKFIIPELEKIATIHLILQGYEKEKVLGFKLNLTPPSNLHEMEKLELMEKRLEIAERMKDSEFFDEDYIYENIFDLTEAEIAGIRTRKTQDKMRIKMDEQIVEESIAEDEMMGDGDDELIDDIDGGEGSQGGLTEPNSSMDSVQSSAPSGRVDDLLSSRTSKSPERRVSNPEDRKR